MGAPIFIASNNISFGSTKAELVPPKDISIIFSIIFFVFNKTNFTISRFSYFSSSINIFAISSVFFMVIQIIKATGNNHSLIILFLIFGAMLMCALTYIVYIKNNIVGIKPRKKG